MLKIVKIGQNLRLQYRAFFGRPSTIHLTPPDNEITFKFNVPFFSI